MADQNTIRNPTGLRKQLKSIFIEDPSENDVLFGRGAPYVRWKGNVRFREVVSEWKSKYLGTRRQNEKHCIATEIIDEIRVNRGGRFLVKYDQPQDKNDHGISDSAVVWVPADENLIIEKVKQTLRDRQQMDALGKRMDRKTKKKAKPPAGLSRHTTAGLSQANHGKNPRSSVSPLSTHIPKTILLGKGGIVKKKTSKTPRI